MNNKKSLEEFRNVVLSYSETLKVVRNNISRLLGGKQNYWSGIYRESLVKEVLRKMLPKGVSIDTGFIYGYGDHTQNSKQLDIIIWNSNKHSPVYSTSDFVVLTAESVLAIISVKSRISKKEIAEGIDNLSSVIPLDLSFRNNFSQYFGNSEECRPISKYLLFLDEHEISSQNKINYGKYISNYFINLVNSNEKYKKFLRNLFKETSFVVDTKENKENKMNRDRFKIIYPRHILCATTNSFSYYFGFGENSNISNAKWIPTLYYQNSFRTTPFEKFIYYLMQDIYMSLGTFGIPFLSAIGNINPKLGWDNEDVSEIDETLKFPLIDI